MKQNHATAFQNTFQKYIQDTKNTPNPELLLRLYASHLTLCMPPDSLFLEKMIKYFSLTFVQHCSLWTHVLTHERGTETVIVKKYVVLPPPEVPPTEHVDSNSSVNAAPVAPAAATHIPPKPETVPLKTVDAKSHVPNGSSNDPEKKLQDLINEKANEMMGKIEMQVNAKIKEMTAKLDNVAKK